MGSNVFSWPVPYCMKILGPFFFLFIAYWPMNRYLIASVKSIMSDLFRSWPREGLCVYVSGLSQQGMRDVRRRIMAFTYPQRAAYQSCLARVFDSAQVQMLPCGCWVERNKRIMCLKSSPFPLLYFFFWEVAMFSFFALFCSCSLCAKYSGQNMIM